MGSFTHSRGEPPYFISCVGPLTSRVETRKRAPTVRVPGIGSSVLCSESSLLPAYRGATAMVTAFDGTNPLLSTSSTASPTGVPAATSALT